MKSWQALLLYSVLLIPWSATAQTWPPTSERTTPSLWEIIAVDRCGEADWPYLREDIADDGLGTFDALETRVDVRSFYSAHEGSRIWLRFYVSSTSAPSDNLVAFYFVDTDRDALTGGSAAASSIWGTFAEDPTEGGYERVIGFRVDGTIEGLWSWDDQNQQWARETDPGNNDFNIEAGVDEDPLLLNDDRHGYLQLDVEEQFLGAANRCDANFFLRVWNDDTNDSANNYGDLDASGKVSCQPVDVNQDNTPDVIQVLVGCRRDSDCPGQSVCFENRVCLIGYECAVNSDCRPDEDCINNGCVRISTVMCANNNDCGGLVCDSNGACVGCNDSTLLCGNGEVCSPSGVCFNAPECMGDADCGNGFRCSPGGTCVDDAFCFDNNDCLSGQLCAPNGSCVDVPDCTGDADCAAGQFCTSNGACADGQSCAADADCATGEICSTAGACVIDPSCEAQGNCPDVISGTDTSTSSGGDASSSGGTDASPYGDLLPPGAEVQGGACACSSVQASPASGPHAPASAALLALLLGFALLRSSKGGDE